MEEGISSTCYPLDQSGLVVFVMLHLNHMRGNVSHLGFLALRGGASDSMVMVMTMFFISNPDSDSDKSLAVGGKGPAKVRTVRIQKPIPLEGG